MHGAKQKLQIASLPGTTSLPSGNRELKSDPVLFWFLGPSWQLHAAIPFQGSEIFGLKIKTNLKLNIRNPLQFRVGCVGDDERGLGELPRDHGTRVPEECQDVVVVPGVEEEGAVRGGGPHLVELAVVLEPGPRKFSS